MVENKLKMDSFNEALKGGAKSVDAFLKALRGEGYTPEVSEKEASEKELNNVLAGKGIPN